MILWVTENAGERHKIHKCKYIHIGVFTELQPTVGNLDRKEGQLPLSDWTHCTPSLFHLPNLGGSAQCRKDML